MFIIDPYRFASSSGIAPPTINADYAYAKDMTTGQVLYTKDSDTQAIPASTTKLMTALVVLRNKRSGLADTVTVATGDLLSASFSQMGLQDGDVITFEDLLYGMLLPSGGDACQAAARVVGDLLTASGGVARFVTEMNTVAAELGMSDSSFANTYGNDEAGQYVTAHDSSLLMDEVLSEPILAGIIDTSVWTATITGTNARSIFMSNTNPILEDEGVIGGKTGTYLDAGASPPLSIYNLDNAWVAPNGNTVVIVTLHSDSAADRQADQRAIIAQLPTDYPYLAVEAERTFGEVLQLDGDTLQLSAQDLTLGT